MQSLPELVGFPAKPIGQPIAGEIIHVGYDAQYDVQKNADLRVNLIYERWSTDDWSWTMFPVSDRTPWAYETTTDGTTMTANAKQESTIVGIRYLYRF